MEKVKLLKNNQIKVDEIWSSLKENLAEKLSAGNFKTWIEPLTPSIDDNHKFVLKGPNSFFLNWVKSHFSKDINNALKEISPKGVKLELFFSEESFTGQSSELLQPKAPQIIKKYKPDNQPSIFPDLIKASPLKLNPKFTFDSFVVGQPNRYAFSAAKAIAEGEDLGTDSLFITSDHGLGKSHLAQALGQSVLKKNPGKNIFYLTAEDFTNEMVHSIKSNTMENFKDKYRKNCDVLMLEGVHFLSGKDKVQTELCFTLDYLLEDGKSVIFTSPQEPKNIPRLSRNLRSRLTTALISPIGSPDYDTRLGIIARKSCEANMRLPMHISEFLAERLNSDVRQLESALMTLRAKSRLLNQPVCLEMARDTLAHLFDEMEEGLSLLSIKKLICWHFHLSDEELCSKSRRKNLIQARSAGMYLARQLTNRTLEEIGKTFGRNHSTTLYAINQMDYQLKKDTKLNGVVDFLREKALQV